MERRKTKAAREVYNWMRPIVHIYAMCPQALHTTSTERLTDGFPFCLAAVILHGALKKQQLYDESNCNRSWPKYEYVVLPAFVLLFLSPRKSIFCKQLTSPGWNEAAARSVHLETLVSRFVCWLTVSIEGRNLAEFSCSNSPVVAGQI